MASTDDIKGNGEMFKRADQEQPSARNNALSKSDAFYAYRNVWSDLNEIVSKGRESPIRNFLNWVLETNAGDLITAAEYYECGAVSRSYQHDKKLQDMARVFKNMPCDRPANGPTSVEIMIENALAYANNQTGPIEEAVIGDLRQRTNTTARTIDWDTTFMLYASMTVSSNALPELAKNIVQIERELINAWNSYLMVATFDDLMNPFRINENIKKLMWHVIDALEKTDWKLYDFKINFADIQW